MIPLQEQLGRVWNRDVRPLVEEASRAYENGIPRAAILLTWAAVCTDLVDKVAQLADDGDAQAHVWRSKLDNARQSGITVAGVKAMQEIERDILSTAVQLELIDTVNQRELERLREDRHLCVHPSLKGLGEVYEPTIEYARAHLAVALESVLTQPPSQGRKVVERFQGYVSDSSFSPAPGYLRETFMKRVRSAARWRIVDLAVKHAVRELDATDPPGAVEVANRMGVCLDVFCEADRGLVRKALAKNQDVLMQLDNSRLLRALGRLGHLDVFWEVLDDSMTARIDMLVDGLPAPESWELSRQLADLSSLYGVPYVRDMAPSFGRYFTRLPAVARASAMARRVSPLFASELPLVLRDAPSFRSAEQIAEVAVIPHARYLDKEHLDSILAAWAENTQCRIAGGMQEHSINLLRECSHLRPTDEAIWRQFLARVREIEDPDSAYRYEELEAEVDRLFGDA
jgi:hypothetical protein